MSESILPRNTRQALKKMIALTEDMINATEAQTTAIALGNDHEFFHQAQIKDEMAAQYRIATSAFKQREDEFLKLGNAVLFELQQKISRLRSETQLNMRFLEGIRKSGEAKLAS